jgi:murein DD-endopeptidase MepM/ murein hydrolase activator NlpD
MSAKEFFNRHGGRVAAVAFASLSLGAIAIGAAKADNIPQDNSDLARAIFAVPQVPEVIAQPETPIAPVPAIAFEAPVRGVAMNSTFGLRKLSFEPAARMHEGVDYAAPKGSSILATASGQVVKEGLSPSYGNFIEVAHGDGISSFYAHMKTATKLKVGDPVLAGEVVGFVGSTGHSTGPHLHFEIRKDGAQFDPSLFIGRTFASFDSLPFVRSAKSGIYRVARYAAKGGRHVTGFRRAGGRVGTVVVASR